MSVAAHTAPTSISKLGAALIGAGAGILAVALIAALVLFVRRGQFRQWRQIRNVLAASATSSGDSTARLSVARAAYERGDYRRVCALLTKRTGDLYDHDSLPDQLLLAAACDQLGGDERTVAAFRASVAILADDRKRIASLLPLEQLIFADLAQRFPDLAEGVVAIVSPGSVAEQLGSQTNSLAKLRQRVIGQRREADQRRRRYFMLNIVLGGIAAAAAAGAGISGVSGSAKVLIGILALVSAATSTILITLKPAEAAEVARKMAEALGDVSSEIELFETGEAHKPGEIREAVMEIQNRLSAAKSRPRLVPLVALSEEDTSNSSQPATSSLPADFGVNRHTTIVPHCKAFSQLQNRQPLDKRSCRGCLHRHGDLTRTNVGLRSVYSLWL